MSQNVPLEIEFIVQAPEGASLRQLEQLRRDMHDEMQQGLLGESVTLYQEDSLSVDPVTVGMVALALLPVVVDKVADLLIKWFDNHKDCSVTISVPGPAGAEPISITYNPQTTPPEKLRTWIKSAIQAAQAGAK